MLQGKSSRQQVICGPLHTKSKQEITISGLAILDFYETCDSVNCIGTSFPENVKINTTDLKVC
jgi:hypothetical protein